MSGSRPRLLLVDPGFARKRPLMEQFLAQPVTLYTVVDNRDDWVADVMPADRIIRADLGSVEAVHKAVEVFLGRLGAAFDGIGTYNEPSVVLAASLAEVFGLPGPTTAAAKRSSSNKIAMREALRGSGLSVPAFAMFDDIDRLPDAVAEVGFPCVFKPASGADSLAVRKITDAADVAAAMAAGHALSASRIAQSKPVFDNRWLVESYISGPLIAVDGYVQRGVPHVLGLTEMELGPEPCFNIEANWMPPRIVDAVCDACSKLAASVVRRLGFETCGFHAELRVTDEGPKLIEIAARIAGGRMPEGYLRSQGLDLAEVMTRLWLGQSVAAPSPRRRHVMQKGVFPRRDGAMSRFYGEDEASRLPGVFEFTVITQEGQQVRSYPGDSKPIYYYAIEGSDHQALVELSTQVETLVSWKVD